MPRALTRRRHARYPASALTSSSNDTPSGLLALLSPPIGPAATAAGGQSRLSRAHGVTVRTSGGRGNRDGAPATSAPVRALTTGRAGDVCVISRRIGASSRLGGRRGGDCSSDPLLTKGDTSAHRAAHRVCSTTRAWLRLRRRAEAGWDCARPERATGAVGGTTGAGGAAVTAARRGRGAGCGGLGAAPAPRCRFRRVSGRWSPRPAVRGAGRPRGTGVVTGPALRRRVGLGAPKERRAHQRAQPRGCKRVSRRLRSGAQSGEGP